jgi:hypothetical protein
MPSCAFACDCALHQGEGTEASRPVLVYTRPPLGESNRAFHGLCYALLFEAVLWGAVVASAVLYRGVFHR